VAALDVFGEPAASAAACEAAAGGAMGRDTLGVVMAYVRHAALAADPRASRAARAGSADAGGPLFQARYQ
jgi:hypothetical protein